MNASHAHEVGSVVLVELREIGLVLEEIGEQFAGLHGGVGKDVIAVNVDFQRVALFFQVVFHGCQDFSVGDGAGAHPDGVRIVFTGGEAEQQDGGEAQCNEFQ